MTTNATRRPNQHHPTRDALRAVGIRSLEGLGDVKSVAATTDHVRITIGCCGITIKLNTSVPAAREAAKVGLLSPGDRILFRARPVSINGATIEVGIIEIGSLQAIGDAFCLCGVEEWVDGSARIGESLVQFPGTIALSKPWLFALRGEDGHLLWSAASEEEGVESNPK